MAFSAFREKAIGGSYKHRVFRLGLANVARTTIVTATALRPFIFDLPLRQACGDFFADTIDEPAAQFAHLAYDLLR